MPDPIRKAYVDCSAGQIHYRYVAAAGRDAIVFLQQTASSSAMFEQVMTRLRGRYALYALDTPGFGGSFDPEGMPAMTQYCDWMREAVDGIGLQRFHVFGHHTGACLGVEIAARDPQRVRSLMMVGPVPLTRDERDEFRQHFSTPMSPTADGAYLKTTWDYLAALGADRDLALHHREVVDTLRAYMGRYQAYTAVWDQDWSSWYRQVRCPILLLCAADDVLWPYFARAQEQRPDARAVVLSGANFEPDLDPQGTTRAIEEFLAGLD
ncbi:MAG: alpha/beta hydrolase [Gammaproteobacteria bacterium]|nr:alpha/beta hydrolase [Gammaproteobacteria bacterium]